MLVAVKELFLQTFQCDITHEANMLIRLSHPNLLYLFGICTSIRPLRIITQFHGIGLDTATLFQEIQKNTNLTDLRAWMLTNMRINDIQSNNIVVANSSSSADSSYSSVDTSFTYHAVSIDRLWQGNCKRIWKNI